MKIVWNGERCCSSGMCESFAPSVFEIGDDGELQILDANPPEPVHDAVRTAVAACPTEALRLED